MEIDDITAEIIDAAIKLHVRVGPGLLESVYQVLLANQLEQRGLFVERQKVVSFEIDGFRFREGVRIDMLVNETIVVEMKSIEKLAPVHSKQLLTYLRVMNLQVGLLINFGEATLKDGLRRIVNGYTPSVPRRLRVKQR